MDCRHTHCGFMESQSVAKRNTRYTGVSTTPQLGQKEISSVVHHCGIWGSEKLIATFKLVQSICVEVHNKICVWGGGGVSIFVHEVFFLLFFRIKSHLLIDFLYEQMNTKVGVWEALKVKHLGTKSGKLAISTVKSLLAYIG